MESPISQKRKEAEIEFQSGPPPCSSDWWDDFYQKIHGSSRCPFESFLEISRKTFDYISDLVKEDRSSDYTDIRGKSLSVNDCVAIALRILSTGDSFATIEELVGVNQYTVSKITWWFVKAMEKRVEDHIRWPDTEEEMANIKSKFEQIRGLPNCCGAIDTTTVKFSLPSTSDSNNIQWYDQENNACMVLQAIVDADMRFLDILSGLPGSLSDSLVLKSSRVFKLSERRERFDKKIKLTSRLELGEYIVGDAGFPLLPWLITPYRERGLSETKREFNKRHYETWKVAKIALAKLKETWRVIQGVTWMDNKLKLPRIILVCCLLHNILIDQEDDRVQNATRLKDREDSDSEQENERFPYIKAAYSQRENLALYLSANLS